MLRAMASNSQLKLRASDVIKKAKVDYQQRLKPVTKLMETLFFPEEELEEAWELQSSLIFPRRNMTFLDRKSRI